MYNGGSSSDSKKFEQISALSITSLSVFRDFVPYSLKTLVPRVPAAQISTSRPS